MTTETLWLMALTATIAACLTALGLGLLHARNGDQNEDDMERRELRAYIAGWDAGHATGLREGRAGRGAPLGGDGGEVAD